jgi:hypothetical protein
VALKAIQGNKDPQVLMDLLASRVSKENKDHVDSKGTQDYKASKD